MAEGFRQAGFEIILASDSNPDAASTFCLNHPETTFALGDISDLRHGNVHSSALIESPDVVFGGPPCQGFSVAGPQDPTHPSNQLIWEFVDSIRYLKPLAFVMENVPGLLNIQGEMLLDRVVRGLEGSDGGYNVHFEVLNAADFGVPQVRLRVLFVAIPKELVESFSWPMPHFQLPQTVGDCLFDLMVARG